MKKFKFINPKEIWIIKKVKRQLYKRKDVEKIRRLVREKFAIDLSEELLSDDNSVLVDYLKEAITSADINNQMDLIWADIRCKNKLKENDYLSYIVNDIKELLNRPEEYFFDLFSVIYMGLLYNDDTKDSFSIKIDETDIKRMVKRKEISEEDKAIAMKFVKQREQIKSVWRRESNKGRKKIEGEIKNVCKYDTEVAREYYPIPVQVNESNEIQNIPGGCFWYHSEMISLNNFEMYDVRTEINNYKRCSFTHMYRIYEALRDKSIENLLLMEYSLGIGSANQIYSYLYEIKNISELNAIMDLVQEIIDIQPIFIRKDIVDIIFRRIISIDEILIRSELLRILVEKTNDVIEDVFSKVLELWWYAYFMYGDSVKNQYGCRVGKELGSIIELPLKNYFDFNRAYEDNLRVCGVHDWREIHRVEDCFVEIPEYRFSKKQYNGELSLWSANNTSNVTYLEIGINRKGMFIEKTKNEIGDIVLRRVIRKFVNEEVSDIDELRYRMFYKCIEDEFEELKCKEMDMLYKKDVKISGKLKCIHVYAIIQYNIIENLLLSE